MKSTYLFATLIAILALIGCENKPKVQSISLNAEMVKDYQLSGDLDEKNESLLSFDGGHELVQALGLSDDSVRMIGRWISLDDQGHVFMIFPNGLITFRQTGSLRNLGFVGLWKVQDGKAYLKPLGDYYSSKTTQELAVMRNQELEKYGVLQHSVELFDYVKLYRYTAPEWILFFELSKLDVDNYTHESFTFPDLPAELKGKQDAEMAKSGSIWLRSTVGEGPFNLWQHIVQDKRYLQTVPEDISDADLLSYFKM